MEQPSLLDMRICRKSLPSNIKVTKTRTIDSRMPQKARKKVRFTPSMSLCERLKRTKKYRALRRTQTGSGLASILANPEIKLGSQAITSALAIKNEKGIDSIPDIFKYEVSKIKNKNVQQALNSDISNYIVDEAQNKVRTKTGTLFDYKGITFKLKMLYPILGTMI